MDSLYHTNMSLIEAGSSQETLGATGITSPGDESWGTSHLSKEERRQLTDNFIKDQDRLALISKGRESARKYKVFHGPTGVNPFI